MAEEGARPAGGMALIAGILSIVVFPAGILIGPYAIIFGIQSGARRTTGAWAIVLGSLGTILGAAYLTTYTLRL